MIAHIKAKTVGLKKLIMLVASIVCSVWMRLWPGFHQSLTFSGRVQPRAVSGWNRVRFDAVKDVLF